MGTPLWSTKTLNLVLCIVRVLFECVLNKCGQNKTQIVNSKFVLLSLYKSMSIVEKSELLASVGQVGTTMSEQSDFTVLLYNCLNVLIAKKLVSVLDFLSQLKESMSIDSVHEYFDFSFLFFFLFLWQLKIINTCYKTCL